MTPRLDNSQTVEKLAFKTDAGIGYRARIGLLVLQTDQTLEAELAALMAIEGVALYHARLANDAVVSPRSLVRMAEELPRAAELIAPSLGLAAIGYACTSGATIIGETRVAEILARIHPGVPCTNPLTAAKAALAALGAARVGLVTPYTPDVTLAMQANFSAAGIDVPVVGSFYEDKDLEVGKINEASILDAAIVVGQDPRCDSVFISCTSLRSARVIALAEEKLGKPVTASNHALAWHLLRLAGVADQQAGAGLLFAHH